MGKLGLRRRVCEAHERAEIYWKHNCGEAFVNPNFKVVLPCNYRKKVVLFKECDGESELCLNNAGLYAVHIQMIGDTYYSSMLSHMHDSRTAGKSQIATLFQRLD